MTGRRRRVGRRRSRFSRVGRGNRALSSHEQVFVGVFRGVALVAVGVLFGVCVCVTC